MPNEEYAASVAKQILKKQTPKWFWQGNRAYIIWFLDRFFPRAVWVSNLPEQRNRAPCLDELPDQCIGLGLSDYVWSSTLA